MVYAEQKVKVPPRHCDARVKTVCAGFTIFESLITLQRGLVVDSLTQFMLSFFLLLV